MRLSELTFAQCVKPNENCFNMHYDNSDALRQINDDNSLEEVKKKLFDRYGDVEVEIRLDGYWWERVTIKDPAFVEDEKAYIKAKAKWMEENNCYD